MDRHEIRITDGEVEIEAADGWATVGSLAAIEDLIGETYRIEYTGRQSKTAWLNTDTDNSVTIELGEALDEFALDPDRASDVIDASAESGESGYSKRVETFADRLVEIFDMQGADASRD